MLRVESLFGRAPDGPPPKGSVEGIVDALRRGRTPRVFSDRTVSPTFVPDAARATRELLERATPPGLYHCVNTGFCTWLEFATEAACKAEIGDEATRAEVVNRMVDSVGAGLTDALRGQVLEAVRHARCVPRSN